MRRSRSPGSPAHYRALGHNQHHGGSDPISLIRSFNVETNPTRPMRPSPLTASTIRDMPLDLVDRIRSFPLFLSASEEFLVAIGNHLKPQVHSANDHVITEGDDAKAMYWLVRGVVAVTSRDGEAVYAELKAGAFFGEIGVLMDMPRTATIVARTKCLLLVLKKEDLQTVMPRFPEMEKAIRQEGQERLNLLKKKRQEGGATGKSPKTEFVVARTAKRGEVSTGESGSIKDGAVIKSKKRKSPSPGIIEDPAAGSALGSGFVNIRQTLKELPLFSTLPPDILHLLGLSVQPKTFPPFNDIIQQGSPGHEIFFIVRGEAEVVHEQAKSPPGTRDLTRSIQKRPRLKTGQYFGEVSSLGISPGRTATVRSITTVECLMIPGKTLDELWTKCPPEIKSQVEKTAWTRYTSRDDDADMMEVDLTDKALSPDTQPVSPTTPLLLASSNLSLVSKPASGVKDDSEVMEPKDPDPFLSVDMENMRNRRRHSIAPPTTPGLSVSPVESPASTPRTNGMRALLDAAPIIFSVPDFEHDVPAKRVKTLPRRPHSNSLSMAILSDDVLIRIFQYIDIGEMLRFRLVNSHWRKLLTTSTRICHYVDLSLYNRRVTDQVISQTLVPFIGTRALVMDLNNCFHVTDEGFSTLWRHCGKNVIRWKMRSLWDVSANQILEMSECAKGLQEVDWSNCRKVGDNLLGRIVGWVVPEHPPPNAKAIMPTPAALKGRGPPSQPQPQPQPQPQANLPPPGTVIGCPRLNTLNLSYCKHITDRSMAHLAVHASQRLQSLSLTRCTSITDAGFQSWAQYRFEKLTHLCLADCTYLSDNAIVSLVNAAKNLTHLDLSFCCALSDTATEVVALGLPKLRQLRLAFCGSAVSDASLESVGLHLNELEGLSVRGCVRVTGKGLEFILRGCGRLSWVDVSQCRNLEDWLRAGSVRKWGFDSRTSRGPDEEAASNAWPTSSFDSLLGELPVPKTMSVAMLTTPGFFTRPGGGILGRRARQPVRFIIEKDSSDLR